MHNKYTLNIIPDDGILKEVVPVSLKVLERLLEKLDFQLKFKFFDYSCDYCLKHGEMMDKDGMKKLADCDAIFLGALGMPTVPDHISLWGLLIPIRRAFDQYVNLHLVKSGINGVLKEKKSID